MDVDFDLFPANVYINEVLHPQVRFLTTGTVAWVFGLDDNGTPTVVAEGDVETVDVRQGSNWRATVSGVIWNVSRAGGCGCGSPLKRASQRALVAQGLGVAL